MQRFIYPVLSSDLQKSIADAMRELLETFRLPGEAQPIARITETFAEHFFSFRPRRWTPLRRLLAVLRTNACPAEIASQDAVYVLAYSVIMLNTDLHNPQNRVGVASFYQTSGRGSKVF